MLDTLLWILMLVLALAVLKVAGVLKISWLLVLLPAGISLLTLIVGFAIVYLVSK